MLHTNLDSSKKHSDAEHRTRLEYGLVHTDIRPIYDSDAETRKDFPYQTDDPEITIQVPLENFASITIYSLSRVVASSAEKWIARNRRIKFDWIYVPSGGGDSVTSNVAEIVVDLCQNVERLGRKIVLEPDNKNKWCIGKDVLLERTWQWLKERKSIELSKGGSIVDVLRMANPVFSMKLGLERAMEVENGKKKKTNVKKRKI